MLLVYTHANDDGEESSIDLDALVAEYGTWTKVAEDIELQLSELGEVYPEYVATNEGEYIYISGRGTKAPWTHEVAILATLASEINQKSHRDLYNPLMAYVTGRDWDWVNFLTLEEDFRDLYQDEYSCEAELAKWYMEQSEDGIPPHLESYFDYTAYGEHLLRNGYTVYEYEGIEYLFTEQ